MNLFVELAIANALGLFNAQSLGFVHFIVGIAAFKEEHIAVAFEGQNVCADAIEEPAVVADHYGATGEAFEAFFQGTEGVDVDVVGRLVEEEDVALLFQCNGQVQAVALTTGEDAAFLFLVCAREVEAREVGAGIDVATAHAHEFVALRHDFVDALVGIDVLVLLVDVAEFDGFAEFKRSVVGRVESHDEAEQRGLTGTVGTDHADDAVRGQHEVEVGEQHLFAEGFLHMLGFNHLVAETRTVGNVNFEVLFLSFWSSLRSLS